MLHLPLVPFGFDSSPAPGATRVWMWQAVGSVSRPGPYSNLGATGVAVSARAHLCVRSRTKMSFQPADEHSSTVALGTESASFGKEVRYAEGGERPRGIAHEVLAVAPQRADEDQLAPLQLRDREAVRWRELDVGERLLVVTGRRSQSGVRALCFILRAMCSSSRTSLGVRSARWKSARHSSKWPSVLTAGRASIARSPSRSRTSIASFPA